MPTPTGSPPTRKRTHSDSAPTPHDLPLRSKKFREAAGDALHIELPREAEDRMDVDGEEAVTPGELGTRLEGLGVAQGAAEAPAGARRLKLGFVASCAKCRERVPGHWAHYV